MNTIMKDKYGNELNVTMLVVARTTLSTTIGDYLTAGKVYPAGYLLNGELAVLDDYTEVLPVNCVDVSNITESDNWCRVEAAYNRAGFCCGDVVPVKEFINGRKLTTGCVWCLNQSGHWIALPKSNLTKTKIHMTAQALTARMKSAAEYATPVTVPVTAIIREARSMGGATSLNFIPGEIKHDRIVRVEFTKGGKLYTYRLKDGMIAEPGDDAVVIVNNPAYPELKGTKVVRVKEVDTVENLGGSYKYVEHIVSNEDERKAQQELKLKHAKIRLEKKRAELFEAWKLVRRIENEFNQLAEDFFNGKY